MPRPNRGRKLIAFRISPAGLAAVDGRTRPGKTRSETLRAMLAYAELHMPR